MYKYLEQRVLLEAATFVENRRKPIIRFEELKKNKKKKNEEFRWRREAPCRVIPILWEKPKLNI